MTESTTHRKDGQNYAPTSSATKVVVEPEEFVFAAAYLEHGHIYGQCKGLIEAGGTLKRVFDPNAGRIAAFKKQYPDVDVVDSFEKLLEDPSVHAVVSAAIPSERAGIGMKVLDSGKDYFTDKSPFTTLEQLDKVKAKVAKTGQKYMVYYSERLHSESGYWAGKLVEHGAIGDILQVLITAPHRLSKSTRPNWFFNKSKYGGILTDIGSHQFEQFLSYTGATDGTINFARVENFNCSDRPGLEDFGEASMTTDSGISCYCRMDWFTPNASPVWGDGRTFILGTKGTLEVRKYWDPLQPGDPSDRIYLTNGDHSQLIECKGRFGYPFFGDLILDFLNRTENAMTQEHAFKAAELSMKAQEFADRDRHPL